eukprot:3487109-Lingulodinium_polyedra.AAC.1
MLLADEAKAFEVEPVGWASRVLAVWRVPVWVCVVSVCPLRGRASVFRLSGKFGGCVRFAVGVDMGTAA